MTPSGCGSGHLLEGVGFFSRSRSTTARAAGGNTAVLDRFLEGEPPSEATEHISGYDIIAPHTQARAGSSARHAMVTRPRGSLQEFEGAAQVDASAVSRSSVSLTIQTAGITTGQQQRDERLRTSDFFEVRDLPEHHLRLHRRDPGPRRRLGHHRRPDHQGRHHAGHGRVRADRLRGRPLRHPARGLRGQRRGQPQGLALDWNAAGRPVACSSPPGAAARAVAALGDDAAPPQVRGGGERPAVRPGRRR